MITAFIPYYQGRSKNVMMDSLEQQMSDYLSRKTEMSDDEMFLLSLKGDLGALSPNRKALTKSRILTMLAEARLPQVQNQYMPGGMQGPLYAGLDQVQLNQEHIVFAQSGNQTVSLRKL